MLIFSFKTTEVITIIDNYYIRFTSLKFIKFITTEHTLKLYAEIVK